MNKVFTFKDIEKHYTNYIQSFIEQGRTINTSASTGTHTTCQQITLSQDGYDDVVVNLSVENVYFNRNTLEQRTSYARDFDVECYVATITVEGRLTSWKTNYYQVSGEGFKHTENIYSTDKAFAIASLVKKEERDFNKFLKERYEKETNFELKSKKNQKMLQNIFKNHQGFKTKKASDVRRIYKHNADQAWYEIRMIDNKVLRIC